MRTLIELTKIILEEYKKQIYNYYLYVDVRVLHICIFVKEILVFNSIITKEEKNVWLDYFLLYKPASKHPTDPWWSNKTRYIAVNIRLEVLKQVLKNLTDEND